MATKTELRNKTLEHMKIIGLGKTASASDASIVDDAIDDEHSFLEQEANIDWTTADIPDAVVFSLRDRVAFRVADTFTVAKDPISFVAALYEIKKYMKTNISGQQLKATYY
jgi:hypothetical protein